MQLITKNGIPVFVSFSHLKQHQADLGFLPEAISKLDTSQYQGSIIKAQIDMGRVIGKTACVETVETDEIVFARRTGRTTTTRFVKNRECPDTQYFTMILKWKNKSNSYQLLTAFAGQIAEKELDDRSISSEKEYQASKKFWSCHALVWGSQEIVSKP